MIKATFDDRKLKAKVRKAQGKLQKLLNYYGNQVEIQARKMLDPIYDRETHEHAWDVTQELIKGINSEPTKDGTGVVIFNEVPYARIRHYENKAHPTTIGYFSKPLFRIRKPMRDNIRRILAAMDD